MFSNRMITGFLFALCLAGVVSAEQGVGLQADMLSQGLAYRALSGNGFGIELAGRIYASPDSGTFQYDIGGELRILKVFNMDRRVRLFVGGGAGYWRMRNRNEVWNEDYTGYTYEWSTEWGISPAALLGFDLIVVQMEDGSGLTVMPEVQLGYYTRPYEELWVGPGVGIGLRYIW